MKIKDGFMLREIAGVNIVVPIGERVIDFNGLITLNETGVLLWNAISGGRKDNELAQMLADEYEVEYETASEDVAEFIKTLKEAEIIV